MSNEGKENPTEREPLAFSEFLESVPPGTTLRLGPVERLIHGIEGALIRLCIPEIRLFCTQESCDGYRFSQPTKVKF
jgi:hypothetical protein